MDWTQSWHNISLLPFSEEVWGKGGKAKKEAKIAFKNETYQIQMYFCSYHSCFYVFQKYQDKYLKIIF